MRPALTNLRMPGRVFMCGLRLPTLPVHFALKPLNLVVVSTAKPPHRCFRNLDSVFVERFSDRVVGGVLRSQEENRFLMRFENDVLIRIMLVFLGEL